MANNLRTATLTWTGGMVFKGGGATGPSAIVDGDGQAGPSPMITLLIAAAGCTGSDVVSILEKMRVEITEFRIEVVGTRREDHPRRYVALDFTYHLSGVGLDEPRARRAIDLSMEKYCSVMHSLAPDIRVGYQLVLTPAGGATG